MESLERVDSGVIALALRHANISEQVDYWQTQTIPNQTRTELNSKNFDTAKIETITNKIISVHKIPKRGYKLATCQFDGGGGMHTGRWGDQATAALGFSFAFFQFDVASLNLHRNEN